VSICVLLIGILFGILFGGCLWTPQIRGKNCEQLRELSCHLRPFIGRLAGYPFGVFTIRKQLMDFFRLQSSSLVSFAECLDLLQRVIRHRLARLDLTFREELSRESTLLQTGGQSTQIPPIQPWISDVPSDS